MNIHLMVLELPVFVNDVLIAFKINKGIPIRSAITHHRMRNIILVMQAIPFSELVHVKNDDVGFLVTNRWSPYGKTYYFEQLCAEMDKVFGKSFNDRTTLFGHFVQSFRVVQAECACWVMSLLLKLLEDNFEQTLIGLAGHLHIPIPTASFMITSSTIIKWTSP